MRLWIGILIGLLGVIPSEAMAQGPRRSSLSKSADVDDLVARMMVFDKNKDSKLTRAEIIDERVVGLFDRADGDKSGDVTKDELASIGAKEHSDIPDFDGPGGPGGPPPAPGEILPARFQDALKLTDSQKHEAENLQLEVAATLEKILGDDQKKQFKAIQGRRGGPPRRGGPRGPGGPPRSGGPRGPGGPPMNFPTPGDVLPKNVVEELKLTDGQKSRVASLQETVNHALEKMLDANQKQEWKKIRERRPMGPPPRRDDGR